MKNITNSDDFALRVRQRRLELKRSQAQLAAQVGVSRQWIIDIEKGKPRAELALALKLLQALDLQLQLETIESIESVGGLSTAKTQEDKATGEAKIQELAKAFDFL